MQFTDRAELYGTRLTQDGYLTTVAKSVRTGIQLYSGAEVGKPELDVVRVMRLPDEVMSTDSLQSFSHAPVTLDHPAEPVSADNWRALAVGEVSTAAKVDDDGWVQLPLVLKDAKAIREVQSGKRELSAGYNCELDWTAGTTEDGQKYDAVQRNIRINHLAVVDKARAGTDARIGDWGASPINDTKPEPKMTTKIVMVDGLSVETTEAGATAIEKLVADRDAQAKALADAEANHAKELAKVEAERDDLKAKVMDDAALDARVVARADLVTKAKALTPSVVTDGKSDLDIKRAVLTERKIALDGKSEAYIEARFDTLVEDSGEADQTAEALAGRKTDDNAAGDESRNGYLDRLTRKGK